MGAFFKLGPQKQFANQPINANSLSYIQGELSTASSATKDSKWFESLSDWVTINVV